MAQKTEPRFDLLTLEWYVHVSKPPIATARPFVELLRKYCPQALPRRFGFHEPLEGKLSVKNMHPSCNIGSGSANQRTSYCSSSPKVRVLEVTFPFHPKIGTFANKPTAQFVSICLEFDGTMVSADSRWCENVVSLFTEGAVVFEAFYAHSYLEPDYTIYRGWWSPTRETKQYPLPYGHEWYGIPDVTTWLNCYGRPYKSLVEESLRGLAMTVREGGILLKLGEKPVDLDALRNSAPRIPFELLGRRTEERMVIQWGKPVRFGTERAPLIPEL